MKEQRLGNWHKATVGTCNWDGQEQQCYPWEYPLAVIKGFSKHCDPRGVLLARRTWLPHSTGCAIFKRGGQEERNRARQPESLLYLWEVQSNTQTFKSFHQIRFCLRIIIFNSLLEGHSPTLTPHTRILPPSLPNTGTNSFHPHQLNRSFVKLPKITLRLVCFQCFL